MYCRLTILIALAFAVTNPLCATAQAQNFPARPITMLVGLAPGGVSDVMARVYAEAVAKRLGQPIVVENKPAASGAVAAAALQHAPPDGYTLLVFSGSQNATIPAIEPSAAYDPVKGAAPITLLFNLSTVLAVPAESTVNSFADLLALGKTKSGGLTFGSPGLGTPSHLMSAKLMTMTGTPVQFVHYHGGAPMVTDLLAARLDVAAISTPLAKAYLLVKKIKPVAIDGPSRWSLIAETPTLDELKLGDASVAGWFGVAAAPGTPAAIIAKLHDAFIAASQDPMVLQRIEENGLSAVTSTPEAMGSSMAKEAVEMAQLVQKLGLNKQ
jgi:tripartite-type tricarboxylate transporter receptor subunit TctC